MISDLEKLCGVYSILIGGCLYIPSSMIAIAYATIGKEYLQLIKCFRVIQTYLEGPPFAGFAKPAGFAKHSGFA